jgi:hemolysin III
VLVVSNESGIIEKTEVFAERAYHLGEEIANSITHGVGTLLSVAGLALMLVLAASENDAMRIASSIIYGSTLILLFLLSTLYHSFKQHSVKEVLQTLDHCAIYLLIAGTYTPFLLVSLKGAWGYSLMAIIWGLAIFGIVFKIFFRKRFPKISLFTYLAMGWLIVVAATEMITSVPSGGLMLLALGGLVYTVGVIFYVWDRMPYNHAVWHLFVLGGSICHFFAIYGYVIPVT